MNIIGNLNVNLEKNLSIGEMFSANKIVYHHIATQKDFSIIALVVPANMEFSLHNHPDILGVTKLLTGRLLI